MNRELTHLASVLHQIAFDAGYAFLCRSQRETVRFCVSQYNRIHARLSALDPDLTRRFGTLPEDANAAEVRILARALASLIAEKQRKEQEHAGFSLGCFELPWPCFSLKLDLS